MVLTEERRDLFTVSSEYYLAQCISSDFGMGKGIAVEFNKRYDMKNKITKLFPAGYLDPDGNYEIGCELIDNVFNLITKHRYWEKPTYKTLKQALYFMSVIIEDKSIKKVAMPKIGCGLDRLKWPRVREIIEEVFEHLDVEFFVCEL